MSNIGKRFGMLEFTSEITKTKTSGGSVALKIMCRCNCGKERLFRFDKVVSGRTKSCGCAPKGRKSNLHKSVTNSSSGSVSKRLYRMRDAMMSRCFNPKHDSYKNYGGRGITVCDEWVYDSQAFYTWAINNGFRLGLTLDRKDVNGNYNPDNCRLSTVAFQGINRRTNKFITIDGVTKTIGQWASLYGIAPTTVASRFKKYGDYALCLYNMNA